MIVYIVTSGEYSGYRIEAVCSTKEKAQAYVKDLKWVEDDRSIDIEEWEVDIPREEKAIEVGMTRDGEAYMRIRTIKPRGHELIYNGEQVLLLNTVATDDEERAVKITNELRTRLIALDRWHTEGEKVTCPSCGGKGLNGQELCSVCNGFGKVHREEAIE